MLNYKLIAVDLDGTLLDSNRNISTRTKELIHEYQSLGGIFTLATGRMEDSAKQYADDIGISPLIIAYNGAKIVDLADNAVYHEAFLNPDFARNAYQALREIKKDVVIYYGGHPHVAEINPNIERYINRIKIDIRIIDNIHDIINENTKKLLVIDPLQEFDRIREILAPIFGDQLNCVSSDDEFLEILPPNVSKGDGLRFIAQYFNIDIGATIAIGDHLNDISMIEAAGVGVAVENATEPVLRIADFITTDNNHEGVARVLEKVIAGEILG